MPQTPFLFQKIFELVNRQDLIKFCEIEINDKTKVKYDRLWQDILQEHFDNNW